MAKYYVIGLGGYGSKLAEELSQKMKNDGSSVFSAAIDTDREDLQSINCDYKFDLSCDGDFASTNANLKKQDIEIFPDFDSTELNYAKCLLMDRGSSLWRMKAYVSFINYMADEQNKKALDLFIEQIAIEIEEYSEIYFIGSLAGGTSSALALPLALYLKKKFRELNYKNYKTIFFASSPDIFAISFNGELKTKAFANAYATLLEINTVNLTANRRDVKKFAIGNEKLPFGKLFDGASGEYNYKECAPFNDIVLFDRMPSVTSVDSFRITVCTYIYYYYLGLVDLSKNTNFNDTKIYSSYCVSELNYSLENNLDYIAKYIVNKKLNNEFSLVYKNIEKTQNTVIIDHTRKQEISSTEEFTRSATAFVQSLHDEKLDKCSLLLGRNSENNYSANITEDFWTIKYFEKIQEYYLDLIKENKQINDFKAELLKSYYTKEKQQKINFNSKTKKLKLKEFTARYNQLFNQLKGIVNNLIDEYFNNENIDKLIYENDQFNIENVIIEGGNYIHPTLALIKLSQLFNLMTLKERYLLKLNEQEINQSLIYKQIPNKILEIETYIPKAKGYGKLGKERLIKTFNENKETLNNSDKKVKNIYLIKKPKIDEKYILSDFNEVLQNGLDQAFGIFISRITKSIGKLIDNYSEIYKNALRMSEKLTNELNELIAPDVVGDGFYQVRSSLAQRVKDVTKYESILSSRGYEIIDGQYGKNVYEHAKCLDKEDLKLESIISDFYSAEKEQLKESELYIELSGKNIFSAMCEPSIDNYSKSLLAKSCKIKPHLITEGKPDEIDKRTLFVCREVAQYVVQNAKNLVLRESSLEGAMEELLSSIGDYETQVKIYDKVLQRQAFVVAEKSAVSLPSITKFNCEDGSALYKAEYERAIENKSKYYTEMWNPHLFLLDGETQMSSVQ